jgi:hypothetical protein
MKRSTSGSRSSAPRPDPPRRSPDALAGAQGRVRGYACVRGRAWRGVVCPPSRPKTKDILCSGPSNNGFEGELRARVLHFRSDRGCRGTLATGDDETAARDIRPRPKTKETACRKCANHVGSAPRHPFVPSFSAEGRTAAADLDAATMRRRPHRVRPPRAAACAPCRNPCPCSTRSARTARGRMTRGVDRGRPGLGWGRFAGIAGWAVAGWVGIVLRRGG